MVELMVVVAIMGVLASIAIPSFHSYRRKAWQSEAKSSLTHIYTAEQNFHSKWGVYIGALHPAGVDLRGDLRYAVGFNHLDYGFCGYGDAYTANMASDMNYVGVGPMAAQQYTGATECATASSISGVTIRRTNRGVPVPLDNYCGCRNNQCKWIGQLLGNDMTVPFKRFRRVSMTRIRVMGVIAYAAPLQLYSWYDDRPARSQFVFTQIECNEFAAGAVSNIKGNAMYDGLDIWGITHQKVLKHVKSGL